MDKNENEIEKTSDETNDYTPTPDTIIQKIIYNQMAVEQHFARILCENPKLNVIYSKDKETSSTNGERIILTPEIEWYYLNKPLLLNCCKALDIPLDFIRSEIAVKVIAHGLCIHECLHILYPCFDERNAIVFNLKSRFEKLLFADISNCLEDAYIEKRGCAEFENVAFYLTFLRYCMSHSFYTNYKKHKDNDLATLLTYLFSRYNSFCHPEIEISETLSPYIDTINELADKAVVEDDPEKRMSYSLKILETIEPLLNSCKGDDKTVKILDKIYDILENGASAKNIEANPGSSAEKSDFEKDINSGSSTEKSCSKNKQPNIQNEAQSFLKENSKSKHQSKPNYCKKSGNCFAAPSITPAYKTRNHVTASTPAETAESRREYADSLCSNHLIISKMTKKISELIFGDSWELEPNKPFGCRINTRMLGDVKERYWYTRRERKNTADLSVAIIIDCSGSMYQHQKQIKDAALILRESLQANEIPFCIAFHNYLSKTNIYQAAGFNSPNSGKSAIYSVEINGSSCESDALEWAYKSLTQNTDTSKRLIISISDGEPDDILSAQELVKTISRRGVNAVAIAVNNAYRSLSRMYPHCIECSKTDELPEKLTGIITRALKGGG